MNHLTPVGNPSRQAPKGEHDREHVGWNAESAVYDATVEVDVRVQLAFDEVVICQRDLFKVACDIEHGILDAQMIE